MNSEGIAVATVVEEVGSAPERVEDEEQVANSLVEEQGVAETVCLASTLIYLNLTLFSAGDALTCCRGHNH